MDEKLNNLIVALEEERENLLKIIERHVQEHEYQLAHFHQKALFNVNNQLRIFKKFEDGLYDEKDFLQSRIDITNKIINSENGSYLNHILNDDVTRYQSKLEQLNKTQSPIYTGSVTTLDEILSELFLKKIKSFKLYYKKADNLFLEFSYAKNSLKVILPNINKLLKKDILYDGEINSFKTLGFKFTEKETKLVLILKGNKETLALELKIILSKITFEVFRYKEFKDDSFIEIKVIE